MKITKKNEMKDEKTETHIQTENNLINLYFASSTYFDDFHNDWLCMMYGKSSNVDILFDLLSDMWKSEMNLETFLDLDKLFKIKEYQIELTNEFSKMDLNDILQKRWNDYITFSI